MICLVLLHIDKVFINQNLVSNLFDNIFVLMKNPWLAIQSREIDFFFCI